MAYRAHAERDGPVIRVVIFEPGENETWSVMEMAEHENLEVIMHHIFDKFEFLRNEHILVQDAEGEWVEPDCITVTEALECTL